MITKKTLVEINKILQTDDITFAFKLKLNVKEWGNYKKDDEDTFYIKLLDKRSGLAKFSIDKHWDIVSCKIINTYKHFNS